MTTASVDSLDRLHNDVVLYGIDKKSRHQLASDLMIERFKRDGTETILYITSEEMAEIYYTVGKSGSPDIADCLEVINTTCNDSFKTDVMDSQIIEYAGDYSLIVLNIDSKLSEAIVLDLFATFKYADIYVIYDKVYSPSSFFIKKLNQTRYKVKEEIHPSIDRAILVTLSPIS